MPSQSRIRSRVCATSTMCAYEPVESPMRSTRRWRRGLGSLVRASLTILVLIALCAGAVFAYVLHWAATPLPIDEPVLVELLPGGTFAGFANELQANHVLQSDWPFILYARWKGAANRVQAGEYRVLPGATPDALL